MINMITAFFRRRNEVARLIEIHQRLLQQLNQINDNKSFFESRPEYDEIIRSQRMIDEKFIKTLRYILTGKI